MQQPSRALPGKENAPKSARLSRHYPPVREQIEYYNGRSLKASQIPRLIKSTTVGLDGPHRSPVPSVESSEFDDEPDSGQPNPRASVVPTASSVYTESPEFPPGFDPVAAQVAPLFASRSTAPPAQEGTPAAVAKRQTLALPPTRKPLPSSTPLKLPLPDRAAKAGVTGLGLETGGNRLQPWHGNTGTTNLMTPIADASVTSGDGHSVSPVSSRDTYGSIYARYADNGFMRSSSPGPTISDTDNAEFRSALAVPYATPSKGERAQQSYSKPEHERSDQTLHERNYVTSKTPEEYTSVPNTNEWLLQPDQKHPKEPNSRFSWTTKATEYPYDTTPTKPSFEPSTHLTPPRNGPAARQPLMSRFSWTTRDTRPVGVTNSPPTPPPRAPAPLPRDSIMARGHPFSNSAHSSAQSSPKGITVRRRPTPSMTSAASGLSDKTGSEKELPLSPPELDSIDIITALQAQLEDCTHRKANLHKLIHAHTALEPQNPLVQDMAKRKANREKVEQFERDLSEVLSREHDLGLRLHRAWKRRDQEAPTAIWVRRICS